MIWFMSYTWGPTEGRKFSSELTTRHPLLVVKDWHEKHEGNNGSELLYFCKLADPDDDENTELHRYIQFSLEDNGGELGAMNE